jgi:hypothetical protein
MSEPLTAAGARDALLAEYAHQVSPGGSLVDVFAERLDDLIARAQAEAAARAVDEALSVVSDLRSVLVSEHGHDSDGPAPWPACLPVHIALNRAAALVAHLRGPRP